MNDSLMRLPDLVREYARYYEVDPQDAAHALHELMKELQSECRSRGETLMLPDHIFWVGRVGSSKRSVRVYKLIFDEVVEYFNRLCDLQPELDKYVVRSYCVSDSSAQDIPAGLIYVSKIALSEWILDLGIELPSYMLNDDVNKGLLGGVGGASLQGKELASISLIINGLISLIKEVDKAHTDLHLDDASRKRADTIRRRALGLRPSRKNFDLSSAILSLADAAEVDMPKSRKTLKKYMGDSFTVSGDESI